MAKRKFNQKARALQPAVMKLNFRIPVGAEGVTRAQYIDISESVSRLNRRFYRQGLNWAVANVKVSMLPAAQPGVIPATAYVNSLQHSWTTANSWVKSFHAWKDQQDEAIDAMGAESAVARYRDYKVHADTDHIAATFANNLDPYSIGPGTVVGPPAAGLVTGATILPAEEWEASQIVIPNDGAPGVTNEYYLHMLGLSLAVGAGDSKGIISGYEHSRSHPQSPDPATPAIESSWLNKMHDVGDNSDDIVTNAQDNNAELPYDQDNYPGGATNFAQMECQGYIMNNSNTGVSTFNTGPFTAPCGLIRLDFLGQTTANTAGYYNIVTVELVPGNHRGYLCETMEEF